MRTSERRGNLRLHSTSLIAVQGDTSTARHGECMPVPTTPGQFPQKLASRCSGSGQRHQAPLFGDQRSEERLTYLRERALPTAGERVPSRYVEGLALLTHRMEMQGEVL